MALTYTPRDACEFPSDNPDLHSGAAWICLEPLAPARAVLRSSLLPRIQAELLTPARPNKQTASPVAEPAVSQGVAEATPDDDVVSRLIALVERLDPLAPPPPLPDLDLALESQRMLTAFSLCRPVRIVNNVPAPPEHVYRKVDSIPAPPAHVYHMVEQASAHGESDDEPMTLRGFELASALVRAQSLLDHDSSTTWDVEQVDQAIAHESQTVAVTTEPEPVNEADEAVANPDGETQSALAHDQLDLDFDWDRETTPRSETRLGNDSGESRRLEARDQLDLEFEWTNDAPSEQTAAVASSAVLELVEAHTEVNEPQNTAESAPQQHGFAAFTEALVQVALARGATRAAAIIPKLLHDSQVDASLLSDALMTQLAQAKLGVANEGSFRVSESLSIVAQAWRNLLDGSSEDFGACDTTLDDWGTMLLLALLGTQGAHTEIKRELRQRGVAAFGMRAAA